MKSVYIYVTENKLKALAVVFVVSAAIAVTPLLLEADVTKGDSCSSPFPDLDCDGIEDPPEMIIPCRRGGGGGCNKNYDLDRTDPNIGSCIEEICG